MSTILNEKSMMSNVCLLQVGNAIKKFFKGWKKRREIQDMRNENFALHIRRRRFISKVLCEGLVGGGCIGEYLPQKSL